MPFTDTPWSSPESELDADAFCLVCLIDENEGGAKKIKSLCKLPIRSKPAAAINPNPAHARTSGQRVVARALRLGRQNRQRNPLTAGVRTRKSTHRPNWIGCLRDVQ